MIPGDQVDPLSTLLVFGVLALFVVVMFVGIFYAITRFRIVPDADLAAVKTGGKQPVVVVGGGMFVIPFIHKVRYVSLNAIRIPIDRTGVNALPTADKIPADVMGELYVQVDPKKSDDIILAAQALGVAEPREMAARVRDLIESQVTDALRTSAFRRTFLSLNSDKKGFALEVLEHLQEDLAKLGLTLKSVTIPHLQQGSFPKGAENDVFAAEGMRNIAAVVKKNQEETNAINREAEIKIQERNVAARTQALELDREQKQREAEQTRAIAEFDSQQTAETRINVLRQEQARALAEAEQARIIREKQLEQERLVKAYQVEQEQQLAVMTAEAAAKKRQAEEQAAQQQEVARIAREKAVETAAIEKERSVQAASIERDQTVNVASEAQEQAIAEAKIQKEIAIARKKADEEAARASQALAEAERQRAEQTIVTVQEQAKAERQKVVEIVAAQKDQEKARLVAEQEANQRTVAARAEAEVAERQAQAIRHTAKGEADAVRERATGQADALRIEAEGYGHNVTIRADAEQKASEAQASARIRLADAIQKEGEARAGAEAKLIEARNQVSDKVMLFQALMSAIEKSPSIMHEVMSPIAKVSDVKVLQINGLDGRGDGQSSLPQTILNSGLAVAGVLPFLKAAVEQPEIKQAIDATRTQAQAAMNAMIEQVKGTPTTHGVDA